VCICGVCVVRIVIGDWRKRLSNMGDLEMVWKEEGHMEEFPGLVSDEDFAWLEDEGEVKLDGVERSMSSVTASGDEVESWLTVPGCRGDQSGEEQGELTVEEGVQWIEKGSVPVRVSWVKGENGRRFLQVWYDVENGGSEVEEDQGMGEEKGRKRKTQEVGSPVLSSDEKDGGCKSRGGSAKKAIHKIRRYVNPTASRFCHICARSGEGVPIYTCKNVEHAVCRKVICQRCITKYGWETPTDPKNFVCCHCKGECPEKAQCITYKKTNQRRRAKGEMHRKIIEEAIARGENVTQLLEQLT